MIFVDVIIVFLPLCAEMTFYSPFTGPFSSFPLPSNVILTEPATDNTIDIGTSTKRYKTLWSTDVHTSTVEADTVTTNDLQTSTLEAAGITMTGDIDLNSHNLIGVGEVLTTADNVVISSGGLSITGGLIVAIGSNVIAVNDTTVVGRDAAANTGSDQSAVYGGGASSNGPNGTVVGWGASIPDGSNNIAIGAQSSAGGALQDVCMALGPQAVANQVGTISIGASATTTAPQAIAIGWGSSNANAHTVILGDTSVGDISPQQAGCNLGQYFPIGNLYANGRLFTAGNPVTFLSFGQFSTVALSNTTAVTSLTTGSSQVGSLILPLTSPGTQMVMSANMTASAVAGATLTFSLYINNALALALNAIAIPITSTILTVTLDMAVRSTAMTIFAQPILPGVVPNPTAATIAYDPTISNTFDLRAAWSAANAANTVSVFSMRNVIHALAE